MENELTSCDAPTIQESGDTDAQPCTEQQKMMPSFQKNMEAVIPQKDEISSEGIGAKLLELQKELLKLANSKKDYNCVADEIDRFRMPWWRAPRGKN